MPAMRLLIHPCSFAKGAQWSWAALCNCVRHHSLRCLSRTSCWRNRGLESEACHDTPAQCSGLRKTLEEMSGVAHAGARKKFSLSNPGAVSDVLFKVRIGCRHLHASCGCMSGSDLPFEPALQELGIVPPPIAFEGVKKGRISTRSEVRRPERTAEAPAAACVVSIILVPVFAFLLHAPQNQHSGCCFRPCFSAALLAAACLSRFLSCS